jgi:hypothetical protein
LGFKTVKELVIKRIQEGLIYHVPREYSKNEFAQGLVTDDQVIAMIVCCKGDHDYETLPHHAIPKIAVHIFKPKGKYDGYYIKLYFLEPNVCFISVHKSEHR